MQQYNFGDVVGIPHAPISGLTGAMLMIFSNLALAEFFAGQAPDVSMGRQRAAVCFACHGNDGVAKTAGTPHLIGQDRTYLEKVLHAYREGLTRQDPTMTAMAKPLSDRDIVNIAAYYSWRIGSTGKERGAVCDPEIIERIRPIGTIATPATAQASSATTSATVDATTAVARSGATVYQAACAACHDTGALAAPKLQDKAAWAARLNQGEDGLVQHAIQGFRGMPGRGGCTTCSDEEIKAAVQHVLKQAK